jgi:acyl-coenzyme A synthetase/AMP-(fatty) acid ligase
MPPFRPISLWDSIVSAGNLSARVFAGSGASASWGELAGRYVSEDPPDKLCGRSVLLNPVDDTVDPLAAAAALVQLDGIARRIILCPPDLSPQQIAFVAETAEANTILTRRQPQVERIASGGQPGNPRIAPGKTGRSKPIETEWILLTSGTTGVPKLVRHTLASLAGAIEIGRPSIAPVVWSTFYDIRRYGGLQIFLRAALTGTPLVLPGAHEPAAGFLDRAGNHGVTHISGTPSHWRRALMSGSAGRIGPEYVRLSGEIADQSILNQLRSQYPHARIAHAFASTEAGVTFEVRDVLMGFPSNVIGTTPSVEMKVEDGTLRVRSHRTASSYLGEESRPLKDAEGFVDTGDALELRSGRYYFSGRRDGTINVGGWKVHPEEVETVINRHPEVSMALVKGKKSPITGTLVVADVVLKTTRLSVGGKHALQRDILQFCRRELALHKVPAAIHFVPRLAVAETGKLVRGRA